MGSQRFSWKPIPLVLIDGNVLDSHVHSALISSIRELLSRDWTVSVNHVYREVNSCADDLAKLGHRLPSVLTSFDKLRACISL